MDPALPTFDRLMNPLFRALEALGGSGSVEEIYDKVVELEALSDEVLSHLHDPENSTNTEVWYRLAWARTYLKKFGLVDNSTRGVWSLAAKAKDVSQIDPQREALCAGDITRGASSQPASTGSRRSKRERARSAWAARSRDACKT